MYVFKKRYYHIGITLLYLIAVSKFCLNIFIPFETLFHGMNDALVYESKSYLHVGRDIYFRVWQGPVSGQQRETMPHQTLFADVTLAIRRRVCWAMSF